MSNINPNPLPMQTFCYGNRGPTAAKRIKNDIPLFATGVDDALQQSLGFLSRITEPFLCHRIDRVNIFPKIINLRVSATLGKILFIGPHRPLPLWWNQPIPFLKSLEG